MNFEVLIVIEPDGEGYHAFCPALKGLHVDGSTQEEAFSNAKEAVVLYIKSLLKHGDPIPVGCIHKDNKKPFCATFIKSNKGYIENYIIATV